jgi:hypothetical protein
LDNGCLELVTRKQTKIKYSMIVWIGFQVATEQRKGLLYRDNTLVLGVEEDDITDWCHVCWCWKWGFKVWQQMQAKVVPVVK